MATKDQQLNLRVSAEDRIALERAAQLEGVSLSSLVLRAATGEARKVLRAHASTVVTSDVFDALLRSLDEPAVELSPSLEKAMRELPDIVDVR